MRKLTRNVLACAIGMTLITGCDPTPDEGDASHYRAMREVAVAYGAQSGLHWKSQQIQKYLDKHSIELDKVFNFNALMMKHNVLPPVVARYGKSYTVEKNDMVRLSDHEILMVKDARFVTTAPMWRDYIYKSFAKPEEPPKGLLPSNQEELEIWKQAAEEGWNNGVEQASIIFQDSLSRLSKDFEGMILYQELHLQNMISAPYTETTNLGVTGDNQGIRLNDKIIKITRPSVLNTQTNQWQPILISK